MPTVDRKVAQALLGNQPTGTLSAYNPPLRDKIAYMLADAAGYLGAGRPLQQRIISGTRDVIDFVPGVGDAVGLDEAVGAYQSGDYLGAGLTGLATAVGAVPVVGDFAGKGLKKLASRSPNIYNPPVKTPRPFEADYPGGAIADDAGKLQFDIEGRPLTGRFVVGRTQAGGSDVALPSEALDEIAKAGTGAEVLAAPSGLKSRDAGALYINKYTGLPDKIEVDARLKPEQFDRVARHEVAHLVDNMAGGISPAGLNDELRTIYNHQNNPQNYGKKFGPEQHKYKGVNVQRELMAEAIRAYMTDPNYIKTVAPKTAARIREYVNNNPQLKYIIQFNSLAGAVALGLISQEMADQMAAQGLVEGQS